HLSTPVPPPDYPIQHSQCPQPSQTCNPSTLARPSRAGMRNPVSGPYSKRAFCQENWRTLESFLSTLREETSVIGASRVDVTAPPRPAKCSPRVVPFCLQRCKLLSAWSREISMETTLAQRWGLPE